MASSAGNIPTTSVPAVKVKRVSYKQRRMGPAPFASFEDLSDDLDSPEDKPPLTRMPGIREDVRVGPDGTLMSPESGASGSLAVLTPSTPRIDISRASSSSHHDSCNSSPERELYAEGAAGGAKLGLGFKEEGTADLRSSTEELDFHTETGTVQEKEYQRRKQKQINKLTASTVFKYELEAQSEKERKDSTCSDIGLLSISGRTSRLSSVGSAASGGSGISHLSNTSRLSNASHLSVTGSHMSGASGRSTSPHKMLLETSFCGSKPIVSQSVELDSPPSNKHETESLEKVLLAKNVDPRMAIVGDVTKRTHDSSGIVEEKSVQVVVEKSRHEGVVEKPRREDVVEKAKRGDVVERPRCEDIERPRRDVEKPRRGDVVEKAKRGDVVERPRCEDVLERPRRDVVEKPRREDVVEKAKHGDVVERPRCEDVVERPRRDVVEKPRRGDVVEKAKRGDVVERPRREDVVERPRHEDVVVNGRSADSAQGTVVVSETEARRKKIGEDLGCSFERQERELQKPITLNLSDTGKSYKPVQSFSQLVQKDIMPRTLAPKETATSTSKSLTGTPSASPKPSRHAVLKKDEVGSRTPSPNSCSRKSSFTSIFKRNETGVLSPESPTVTAKKKQGLTTLMKEAGDVLRERSRSRSKSRERTTEKAMAVATPEPRESKTKKDAKNKSVFSSFFKKKDRKKGTKDGDSLSPIDISSPETKLPVIDAISNVEFTFNTDGSCQPSEFGIIRNERPQPVLPEDTLLPSESVMLPTLSNLYQDQKELESYVEIQQVVEVVEVRVEQKKRTPPEVKPRTPKTPEVVYPAVLDDVEHHSSESERDSEMEYIGNKADESKVEAEEEEEDHERKGLFVQQDSVDEELPYVPTTLPQERTVGIPIVPIKQRTMAEVKTFPIERPRSTTPINPSLLDEFVSTGPHPSREHKMKISLPREDSITSKKSPRRTQPRSWFEFAEQGLQSPKDYRKTSLTSATSPSPPPLPPRAQPTSPPTALPPPPKAQNWINFEEIPEKRKPPKRIQTIPSRSNIEVPEPPREGSKGVTYSYVNPEDCKCECHESSHRHHQSSSSSHHQSSSSSHHRAPENGKGRCSHSHSKAEGDREAPPPRLEVEDRHSYMSDSSYEYVSQYGGEGGEDFNADGLKVMKPFGMDLDVSSNRSSVISQDDQQSPEGDLHH